MNDHIPEVAALLKQQYLFLDLKDAQIASVVNKFNIKQYDQDSVIINEGSEGDFFYLIFQGKVRITQNTNRKVIDHGVLGPGKYFGEEALLFDKPRTISATACESVKLLCMPKEKLFELMELYPQVKMKLFATAGCRSLVRKENFDWLNDDEVIYLVSRKDKLFFLTSLVLPLILSVLSFWILLSTVGTGGTLLSVVKSFLGVGGLIFSVLWGVWTWLDWGNDLYIVTDKRVVWLERVMVFHHSRREAPLETILSVNVTKGVIGRILAYGHVNVRTFTGGILMRNVAMPELFVSFVEGFQELSQRLLKEAEIERMEDALQRRMGLKDDYVGEEIEQSSQQQNPTPEVESSPSFLKDVLGTFLKVRYKRGDVITYRKHWLLLLRKTWLPTSLGLTLATVFFYLMFQRIFGDLDLFSGLTMFVLSFAILFFLGVWWFYHYIDWSDDVYKLTPKQILDIERKPLGQENKKTASLDSILSLEHTRKGILELMLNFGDVVINVGQTQFIFHGVYNPGEVHQDVANYMQELNRLKKKIKAKQDREQMVDWLMTYRRQSDIIDEIGNESEGETDFE